MAYKPEDQNQDPNQPQGQAQGGGGVIGAGAATTRPTDRQSGAWTNLQDYMKANQPQAEAMAGQIGQGIEQQRQQYGQAVGQAQEQYGQQLGQLEQEQQKRQDWMSNVAGGHTPDISEIQQKQQEGWFKQGQDPGELGYLNPQLQQQQQSLQQRTEALRNEQGRLAELQKLQGQQATRGEGLLNQLLVQNSPEARAMFQQQQQTGTGGYMAPAEAQAQTRLEALKQMQQQYANTARGATSEDVLSQLGTSAEGYGTQAQSYKDLQDLLAGTWYTPEGFVNHGGYGLSTLQEIEKSLASPHYYSVGDPSGVYSAISGVVSPQLTEAEAAMGIDPSGKSLSQRIIDMQGLLPQAREEQLSQQADTQRRLDALKYLGGSISGLPEYAEIPSSTPPVEPTPEPTYTPDTTRDFGEIYNRLRGA